MSIPIIRKDLEGKLKTFATTNSLPVAWENTAFTKPTSGIWLEPKLIPVATLNRVITGVKHTYLGIFQVNVWCPKGLGFGAGDAIAYSLSVHFPVIPKSGFVSVEQTPTVGAPIPDDSGWQIIPVQIKYRYEAYAEAFTGQLQDIWTQLSDDIATVASDLQAFKDLFTAWQSFSPQLRFGGSSVGITYIQNSASYSTANGSVTFSLTLRLSSKGNQVGEASISLPANAAMNAAVTVGKVSNVVDLGFAGTFPVGAYIDSTTNSVKLVRTSEAGTEPMTNADFTDTSEITLSCTYKASS